MFLMIHTRDNSYTVCFPAGAKGQTEEEEGGGAGAPQGGCEDPSTAAV